MLTESGEVTIKPEELKPGVKEAIKYVSCQFLDEKHFKLLHQELSAQWHSLSSLSAAVKLMEQYGVNLSQEEVDRMSRLDEAQQINTLVSKMPQQSNDQFQHFFLQLQILVSTASRVRKALEEGNETEVFQALTEAESTGISQYILRMAIVQAGTEVKTLKTQFDVYLKDCDVKLGKLIRGAEDAVNAQRKLSAAQAQLTAFLAGQNEKVKKVLVSFLGGSSGALQAAFFKEWAKIVKDMRMEAEIRAEFAAREEHVKFKLLEFKMSQGGGILKLMMKKGGALNLALMEEAFRIWSQEILDEKDIRDAKEKAAQYQDKLGDMRNNFKFTMMKFLMRMNNQSAEYLAATCFEAWMKGYQDWQKLSAQEKEQEKAAERLAKFMAEKKDGAKKVLETLTSGQDGAAIKMTFSYWVEAWMDAKREAQIAEAMAASNAKMGQFNSRNKGSAMSATERSAYNMEVMIYIKIFQAWRLDTRMERTHRMHNAKIDCKRQQLVRVQQMFRNFAVQLESGLKESNSNRFDDGLRSGKKLSKSEGSVSLPNIRQATPKGQ